MPFFIFTNQKPDAQLCAVILSIFYNRLGSLLPGMACHAPMAISGFTAQMGKDRKSMTLLLRRPLSAGTYQVSWTAAGMDTHRMSGTFTFTVR